MIINVKNGSMINSNMVNVHDFILENFTFNRQINELVLTLFDEENNLQHIMRFAGVIGFEISACNYWGKSPYILDFEYVEPGDQKIVGKLFAKNKKGYHPFCELKDISGYLETMFTFTSGDQLCIACESVQID